MGPSRRKIFFFPLLGALLAGRPAAADLAQASPSGEEVWRLSCGAESSDYAAPSGDVWMRDEPFQTLGRWGFAGGYASIPVPEEIAGTVLDDLFRKHRFGGAGFSYKVELPNGRYQVRLLFAEVYWTGPGQRVFDVALNGKAVLKSHDVFAEVGRDAADVHAFTVDVKGESLEVSFPAVAVDNAMISGIEVRALRVSDDDFLAFIERKMFRYFWDEADPVTGLVKDGEDDFAPGTKDVASIAATGFGLSVLTVGAARGWITAEAARDRVRATLEAFASRLQNVRGFWYHFVHLDGTRADGSELSTVDSALFILGALQAGEYFRDAAPDIAAKADALYRRMEWDWWLNRARPGVDDPAKNRFVSMGWKPEGADVPNPGPEGGGFLGVWWDAYSEAVFVDLLALASPEHPVGADAWTGMYRPWADQFGFRFVDQPSLFTHQYHHLYFDLKGRHDGFLNFWDNTARATLVNRETCLRDPQGRYGPDLWGLTAAETPDGGYQAYGALPSGFHDGTVAPTAPLTSVEFTPRESLAAARRMFFQYKQYIWGRYGFTDSFNVRRDFRAPNVLGIDNGPLVIAIENYRTGLVRDSFMRWPGARTGLARAGFHGYADGPLIQASSVENDLAPGLAFDGDLSTRWGSVFQDPQWLSADYGAPRRINKVVLTWEAAYGKSYKIQISDDGSAWRDVYVTTSGDGGEDVICFPTVTARFLRFYGTERGTEWGYSLREMRVEYDPAQDGPRLFGAAGAGVGAVYVFPNPARRGARAFFHVEADPGALVELLVRDAAGAVLHRALLAEPVPAGGGWIFEHPWDPPGPGLYSYAVRVSGPAGDARRQGRFSVKE